MNCIISKKGRVICQGTVENFLKMAFYVSLFSISIKRKAMSPSKNEKFLQVENENL